MTDTSLSYDIPYNPPPRPPKPEACREPTIGRYEVMTLERPLMGGGTFLDCWVDYYRSCEHGPVHRAWRVPEALPVIGAVAMSCGGPEPVTAESGRADKTVPPLKKGKRWIRLKESRVA